MPLWRAVSPAGSPFTFLNTTVGSSINSSATFDFSGVTSDGKSSWNAIFTSQFNEPFQSVLATIATSGSATNSYSDSNLVITLSSVPEPRGLALMGVALLLMAAGRVRFQRRHSP